MRLRFFAATLVVACLIGCSAPDYIAEDPKTIDAEHPPGILELAFESNGDRLNAHLYLADGAGPHPTVVLLHGFPGFEKNLDLAQAIRRAGWNVFFFHYRGAWGSAGTFSFSNGVEDVAAALAYLRDPANDDFRVDPNNIVLIGHSMGGFMALEGAARDERVYCVVGAAAANIADLAHASLETRESFARYSDALAMLNGFNGDGALAEIDAARDAFDLTRLAPRLAGKKILLIGAERDAAVDISVFERLSAAYGAEPKISVKTVRFDTDHSFSWARIALARAIVEWLNGECRA